MNNLYYNKYLKYKKKYLNNINQYGGKYNKNILSNKFNSSTLSNLSVIDVLNSRKKPKQTNYSYKIYDMDVLVGFPQGTIDNGKFWFDKPIIVDAINNDIAIELNKLPLRSDVIIIGNLSDIGLDILKNNNWNIIIVKIRKDKLKDNLVNRNKNFLQPDIKTLNISVKRNLILSKKYKTFSNFREADNYARTLKNKTFIQAVSGSGKTYYIKHNYNYN